MKNVLIEQLTGQVVIAVDPGASGGIAVTNGKKTLALGMPDDVGLVEFFATYANNTEPTAVWLEQVGGYIAGNPAPGSAMFNFGDGYGFLRGLCAGLRLRLRLVRPQLWQKGIPGVGPKMKGAERKRALKEQAGRLYPEMKVTLKTADALCLLDFAIRQGKATEVAPSLPAASDFRADAKEATKWAKAQGYALPAKGSAAFLQMVNYYVRDVRNHQT